MGSSAGRQDGPSPPNNGSAAPLSALVQPPCPRKLPQHWGGQPRSGCHSPSCPVPMGVPVCSAGWIAPGDLEEFPLWSWCCVLALLLSAALILLILPLCFFFSPPCHHLKSLIRSSSWARQLLCSCEAFSAEAVPMLKSVASLRGCALVWERLLVLGSLSHFHILGFRLADGRASRRGELGRVGAPRRRLARF